MSMRTLRMAAVLVGVMSVPAFGCLDGAGGIGVEEVKKNSDLPRTLYVGLSAVTSALTSSTTTYLLIDMATSNLWGNPFLQSAPLAPDFASAIKRATMYASGCGALFGFFGEGMLANNRYVRELASRRATCTNVFDNGFRSGLMLGIFTYFISLPMFIRPAGLLRIIG
jgi:hypothetical protein